MKHLLTQCGGYGLADFPEQIVAHKHAAAVKKRHANQSKRCRDDNPGCLVIEPYICQLSQQPGDQRRRGTSRNHEKNGKRDDAFIGRQIA